MAPLCSSAVILGGYRCFSV
ncbi:hypothetical protein AZE42_04744 [Rhizopogon vesiculosus]|uniref:Uncharacterized protein n=1 Tax=Rhizopogon vesiculosus TaxID=180088 RepID=A0A1J8PSX9_9AGAM|nr:hypothetical protein AZE42_04744 [Rhizopogon vesiculosus]